MNHRFQTVYAVFKVPYHFGEDQMTTVGLFQASDVCLYQQSLPDALHHPALDAGLTQDVVWSDARLTTVGELPPCDAAEHKAGVGELIMLQLK